MAATFLKYGAECPVGASDLEIELAAIARGGKWITPRGTEAGLGMFEHMMNARKLLWPERYRHDWTDILFSEFIKNDITVCLGAASTGKTATMAEYALIRYFSKPEKTLVILSTIDTNKLDTGIFGEVKMLWNMAKERFNDIVPGVLIDYKRCIATDDLSQGEVRDMRRGVIGLPCFVGHRWVGMGKLAGTKQENIVYAADECFPAGTLVDTPHGTKAIETIQAGDEVVNCIGPCRVRGVMSRTTERLVEISLRDGRAITCTENHKVFTSDGWIEACNLSEGQYMLSTYEAMHILRSGFPREGTPASVRTVSKHYQKMRAVREGFRSPPAIWDSAFLRSELLRKMDAKPRLLPKEVLHEGAGSEDFRIESCLAQRESRTFAADCGTDAQSHFGTGTGTEEELVDCHEGKRLGSGGARWEWHWTNQGGMATYADVPGSCVEFRHTDQPTRRQRLPKFLQSGLGLPGHQTRNRSGRPFSQPFFACWEGPEEGCSPKGSWVERITILKPSDPGFPKSGPDPGRCRVYNLHVEKHHSYSVSGLTVSNCQFMAETFVHSWPNLFSNGNVKIIASGNPKHDPDDQLGIASEPREGWASVGEPTKVTTWVTKWFNGVCVNLVGTDSPNFHAAARGEPEPYPKLIGPKFAARIAHDWGTDSPEYYTQVKGVMRIDMAVKRVITRQLCREHGAFEKVVWSGRPTTKVMGVDPSYGGGDACVIYVLEFGEDNAGMEVLSVVRMIKVKLDLKKTISVEDQIANEVWDYGHLLKIPPANIGFDPFGKGTLGNAFARKFGSLNAIQPVDSGARPTERPVRRDLYVDEANGEKRLKTCREHYSKFVTEAWFSVRYVIEANQFRGMIESTMIEGCGRKYDMVSGNKIEIESKDDLKERVGKSPNEFDALAIAVEMARRSGFAIGLLGPTTASQDEDFFETEAQAYSDAINNALLHR